MDEPILILCTVPTEEVGESLARGLVEARLAACVNVVPSVLSVYRWNDAVHGEREAQLLIKTRASLLERVTVHLRAEHPYEVPEVLALPSAGGSEAYRKWIAESTS